MHEIKIAISQRELELVRWDCWDSRGWASMMAGTSIVRITA